MTSNVVGRLAPSPTGELHLGHARTFLMAWWSARAAAGRVVLRHEDLDLERSSPTFIDAVRRELEWLGMDWDVERRQSETVGRIHEAADELLRLGCAFPCVCSRGDLRAAASAPHGFNPTGYPGTCRGRYRDLAHAERSSGRSAGLRFERTSSAPVVVPERFAAHLPTDALLHDAFVVLRRDKVPAYHLAVVVDDHFDAVTQVVRGDDLLESTPGQLALVQALGYSAPEYYHVPLVVDERGQRLAKRSASLALSTLRQRGVPAEAIVAWVGQSCGIRCSRLATAQELTAEFSFSRVPGGAVRAPFSWQS